MRVEYGIRFEATTDNAKPSVSEMERCEVPVLLFAEDPNKRKSQDPITVFDFFSRVTLR